MNFGDNVAEKLSLVVFEVQNTTRMAVEKNAFSLMSFCSIRYLQSRKLLNLPLFPTTVTLMKLKSVVVIFKTLVVNQDEVKKKKKNYLKSISLFTLECLTRFTWQKPPLIHKWAEGRRSC